MADFQYPSSSYKTVSNYPPDAMGHGTETKSIGARGPLDVYILNSGNIVLSHSDGPTHVELTTLSGVVYTQTSSFSGTNWHIALSPKDITLWSNVALTVVNNYSNNLQSGSVEFSPDNSNWETNWDVDTFANLTSSGGTGNILSMQIRRKFKKIYSF
jgi:hypothetical protein